MRGPIENIEERPLRLQRRRDLVLRRVHYQGAESVVLEDPISLRYYQLGPEEAWLLERLDGSRSLNALLREFARQFAPRRLDVPQLEVLLRRLRGENLVLATSVNQGEELWTEARRRARRQRWFALLQPWAIRFRGVDPSRLLDAVYPWLRWLFTPWAALAAAGLMAAAIVLAVARWDSFVSRLPPLDAFLRLENAVWLAVCLAIVKVLHELGHALTARHYGVRCHELGFMLLAGIPCLYCNVTAAWSLADKRQRVAIGAAGIVIELVLAAGALLLWWASAPGALHTLCFHTLLVCSVGTLILNGNPLLRYDGYYVLADLLELPNLRDESLAQLEQRLQRRFFGIELRDANGRSLPAWLSWYAVASLVYTAAVLTALGWLCYRWLAPWGGGGIVPLLTAVCMTGLAAPSAIRVARAVQAASRGGEPVWRRFLVRGGVLAAVVLVALCVPLPFRVVAPALLLPRDSRQVYVLVEGRLIEALPPGTPVQKGYVVARLENPSLDREVVALAGETEQLRLRVRNLEQLSLRDPDARLRLPAARESLSDLEEQLRERRLEQARLELKAPRDGVVLPPPSIPLVSESPELPNWSGSPLNERNQGAWLLAETVLCAVGDPERLDALLACDEADVGVLDIDQRVEVVADQWPRRVLTGRVSELARLNMEQAPRELAERGIIPTREAAGGDPGAPLQTYYQVRVELADAAGLHLINATGRAAVHVAPRSIAAQALKYLRSTFSGASAAD